MVAKPDGRDVDASRKLPTLGDELLLLLGDERGVVHTKVGLAVSRHDQVLRVARQLFGLHREILENTEAVLQTVHQIRRALNVHRVDFL